MTDLGFIVKMVIYRCRELGNPVTETLAAYVAQTTLNKRKFSSWLKSLGTGKFYLEGQVTEEEAKKLVKKTIKRLQDVESPSLSKLLYAIT
jgi:hypothetical protein